MSNRDSTLNQFKQYKGQFVIIHNSVKQFVAIAEDLDDFLYVFYDGRKLSLHTILEPLVILKDKIDDKDYNEFIRLAELNFYSSDRFWNIQKTDEKYNEWLKQIEIHKQSLIDEYLKYDNFSYMSDFEWDLIRN